MLLDEDPATLLHHTITNFNLHPDKLALSRINESLSTLAQSRALRLRDAETSLRKLSRTCTTLTSEHRETVAAHDSQGHAGRIVELDTRKFRIAKEVAEVEGEQGRLEAELEGLRGRLVEVEGQGVEGDEGRRREREAEDATMYAFSSLLWSGVYG